MNGMNSLGIIQDALRESGLPRIDVSADTDVPNSRREFILLEVSVCPTKILMLLSPMENPDIFDLDI